MVDASLLVEVTSRPGASSARSLMSLTPLSWSDWWLTVVTTIGTSCRLWLRFCAVTMMSSTLAGALDWLAPVCPAAVVVRAACGMPALSLGCGVCAAADCAYTG